MALVQQKSHCSWVCDDSAMVFGEIFSAETSVAIWQRDIEHSINQYFEQAFSALGLGIRGVFSMETLKSGLDELLPEQGGKQKVIEDIYLLSDMLTCLFNCNEVGLRLAPLSSAMCPSFHVDNITVRLVNTYLGPATQWLPMEALCDYVPPAQQGKMLKTSSGLYYQQSHIQQMNTFDVGLLKGAAWEQHEHMAVTHRSCQLHESEKRVLLTLDPM